MASPAAPAPAAAPRCVVRDVTEADAPALAALYASAFDDNAAYCSIFQLRGTDAAAHAASLTWLFEKRVRLVLGAGGPYLICVQEDEGAGTVLAAGGIVPHARKAGAWAMLREGILAWPFLWGMPSLLRALTINDLTPPHGVAVAALSPPRPPAVAALFMVAVAPEAQGRGQGSALLAALLAKWDAADGGSLELGTQRAQNLPFYQRAGFALTAEWDGGGYTNWTMRREAVVAPAAHAATAAATQAS
jgi:ribosomal protein S18 acetylase RimI-like enzyme